MEGEPDLPAPPSEAKFFKPNFSRPIKINPDSINHSRTFNTTSTCTSTTSSSSSSPSDGVWRFHAFLKRSRPLGELPHELGNISYLERLTVAQNALSGSIPSSIFNISTLRSIDLGYNQFSGELPKELGNLVYLEIFGVSNNGFYGSIPSSISNISALRILDLYENNFSGFLPQALGNLVYLEIFYVHGNGLYGSIPSSIFNISTLWSIDLSENYFSGFLPQELGNLVYLEEFYVGTNGLYGSIPSSIFNISTLRIIALLRNHFSGELPQEVGNLAYLAGLYVSENRINGPIPISITNASKLTQLILNDNLFSGTVPNFGNLRLLQDLQFWGNNLTGDLGFISPLSNCQYLSQLGIGSNPLNGVLPTSIGNLSTSLQNFQASNCNIKGTIPQEIGNLSNLLTFSLHGNELTGLIPTILGKLKHLQGLYLYGNQLQGHIPPDICQMNGLVELILSENMLSGPIPQCFGDLTSLRHVYLDTNKLNSSIPSSFWNLRDLVTLDLSSNNLSGHLSPDIGSFKAINQMYLSFNQFSGDIPSSIDGCQSLEVLSLANNKLEASIPPSFGNIRGLTLLDLSNNNLSGWIPKSLETLRYLHYFNVSYNNLEGEIPTKGPFINFTAKSFGHNFALCGATKLQVPPCGKIQKSSRQNVMLMKYIAPPIVSTIILVIVTIIMIRRRKQNKIPAPMIIPSLDRISWRRISHNELVRGTSSFSEASLLGKGSFGSVFKGTLSDGLNVAIKVFNLQLEGAAKSFDTESEILSNIRHRNLVRIIGCCSNMEFKALILAYMPNGSLEKWLYSENYCLDLLQRLKIAIDVALALEYLHHGHTFPVVHCDIKPSNVLLDEDMTAHVADFGISKLFDEGETVIQTKTLATIGYAAPEYGSEGIVSTNGDVYSYGILLLEIFTSKKPTDDMFGEEMSLNDWVSEALQENIVTEVVAPALLEREYPNFSITEECVASIFMLALQCLAVSPHERINMIEIVAALQKIKAKVVAATGSNR